MENIEKRYQEVEICIKLIQEFFTKAGKPLNLKENSAKSIADFYSMVLDDTVKHYLLEGAYASRFKVASGMEIAAIYHQPVLHSDLKTQRELNALFAMYLAHTFLLCITHDSIPARAILERHTLQINKLYQEHLNWLKYIDTTHELYMFPVFCNALFWQALTVALNPEVVS